MSNDGSSLFPSHEATVPLFFFLFFLLFILYSLALVDLCPPPQDIFHPPLLTHTHGSPRNERMNKGGHNNNVKYIGTHMFMMLHYDVVVTSVFLIWRIGSAGRWNKRLPGEGNEREVAGVHQMIKGWVRIGSIKKKKGWGWCGEKWGFIHRGDQDIYGNMSFY